MDWTLAMALEAGVWGKAGWLELHCHLEEFHTLALCPSTFPPYPSKVLHSVCGVPPSGCHHVCVSVCQPQDVCVHVCACTCIVYLSLTPFFQVKTPLLALSPISCNLCASA